MSEILASNVKNALITKLVVDKIAFLKSTLYPCYEDFRIKEEKMSKKIVKPTESELEILQLLWQNGPSSVRQVNDILNEEREVGYTTTLKIMQIMLEKGLVTRNTDSRTHIYAAGVSESDVQSQLLNKFVQTTFRGSASRLVLQLLGNHSASAQELDEIKSLIEQLEKDNSK
jgi:predicted transcriptional regulator